MNKKELRKKIADSLKIGTKEQVIWEKVLKDHKLAVEAIEKDLIVYKEIINLAESKITLEKEKLK